MAGGGSSELKSLQGEVGSLRLAVGSLQAAVAALEKQLAELAPAAAAKRSPPAGTVSGSGLAGRAKAGSAGAGAKRPAKPAARKG